MASLPGRSEAAAVGGRRPRNPLLRHRHLPGDRHPGWYFAALALPAAAAAVATLHTLAVLAPGSPAGLQLLAALLLLGTPLLHGALAGRFAPGSRRRLSLLGISLLLAGAGLFAFLLSGLSVALLASQLLFQGLELARHREERSARLSLAISFFQTWAAALVAPGDLTLLLLLLQVPLATVALVWLHARSVRNRLALRHGLGAAALPEPGPRALGRRVPYGLGVGLLLLAGVLLLDRWIPEPSWGRAERTRRRTEAAAEPWERKPRGGSLRHAAGRAGLDPAAGAASPRLPSRFPLDLEWKGAVRARGGFRLLEVEVLNADPASLEIGPGAPLYLKSTVFDTFTAQGVHLAPGEVRYLRTGRDGWIRLQPPPEGEEILELRLTQWPLEAGATGTTALFRPEPLLAWTPGPIQYRADGPLTSLDSIPDIFSYSLRTIRPDPERWRRGDPELDLSVDARYLEGSPDPVLQARAEALAREVLGEGRPAVRIQRLRIWLEREFRYSLEVPGPPGPRDLLQFLEARQGYCTWFASLACLVLRAGGIPCRIAGGLAVDQWVEDEGVFAAWEKDAHAWVEVPVRGRGWCPVEVTPAASRGEALARAGFPEERLPEAPPDALPEEEDAPPPGTLGGLLESFSPGQAGNRVLWLLLSGPLLAFLLARLDRGRVRPGREDGRERVRHPPPAPLRRLERALAALGRFRRPGETWMGFARRLAREDPRLFGELPGLVARFWRRRYGGHPWEAEDRAAFEGQIRHLREARRARRRRAAA